MISFGKRCKQPSRVIRAAGHRLNDAIMEFVSHHLPVLLVNLQELSEHPLLALDSFLRELTLRDLCSQLLVGGSQFPSSQVNSFL